jgi:hypothetical protein
LEEELDAWRAAGRHASVWWRDDDATDPTPALDRLLALANTAGVPLALAVIPSTAGRDLARRLGEAPDGVAVLQHGYAHRNHGPAGAKNIELGDDRPHRVIAEELQAGRRRLSEDYGGRFQAVMVPPWNRIGPKTLLSLPSLGFRGLSTYGARPSPGVVPGLFQVNCHVDIMRWRPRREFLGQRNAVDLLTAHLRARRTGAADSDEPTGLLTHHLVHDEACWHFLDRLIELLKRSSAIRFLPPAGPFGPRGGPAAPDHAGGVA